MFKLLKPTQCNECGSGAVFHRIKYIDVGIEGILRSVLSSGFLAPSILVRVDTLERAFAPRLLHSLVFIGLAKKQTKIDSDTELLSQMLWREAEARGISIWEFRLFGLPRSTFVAEFLNGEQIAYSGIPLPPRAVHQVNWIDDKALLKKYFLELGFPVAKGAVIYSTKDALGLFKTLEVPLIAKPRIGSASRHTTIHITNKRELTKAFMVASQVSPGVIIEEELAGAVYRATVVDGELAATLRRDPPYVVGDGVRTVQELVNESNKNPARSGPYFSKIKIDDSAMNELKWYGHTPKDVLPKGKRVTFHQKVNWSVGGTTADVTDEVHPDNVTLFERVAEVLRAPIVGIDFIIGDISRSWKEQERCGIIECNSMPFFDNHHLPFEGKPRNVAGAIWDMVEKNI